jgi:hypothetical protein
LSEEERTPIVTTLLEIIHLQEEMIQQLRDEIAILKGQKPKPQIKPSQLEKGPKDKEGEGKKGDDGKRPGSEKRQKTKEALSYTRKRRSNLNIFPMGAHLRAIRNTLYKILSFNLTISSTHLNDGKLLKATT